MHILRLRRGRPFGQAGTSLPEILVTISVIGLVMGLGVTGITGRYDNHGSATQSVLNDLRLTRMNAITRGAHYRMTFKSGSYDMQRLQDNDGNGVWDTDSQVEPTEVELPYDVALSVAGAIASPLGLTIDFDSRGMVATPSGIVVGVATVYVTATGGINAGKVNSVEVWPSGQIQLEDGA